MVTAPTVPSPRDDHRKHGGLRARTVNAAKAVDWPLHIALGMSSRELLTQGTAATKLSQKGVRKEASQVSPSFLSGGAWEGFVKGL